MDKNYLKAVSPAAFSLKILKKLFFLTIIIFCLSGLGQKLLQGEETISKNFSFQSNQKQTKPLSKAKHFTIKPATSAIKIDGFLNEQAWSEATLIKLPYEWMPGDNIPALVDTDCLVTFDKNFLYIGFR